MARIQDLTGSTYLLGAHHLVGRSRAMHTTLRSATVSAQHIALLWDGAVWSVRELGSSNGTWLDGRRLAAGEIAPLSRGSVLQLGGPAEQLTVIDDGPPVPCAAHDGTILEGNADLLAIPSIENPVAVVHFDPELGWMASIGPDDRPVRDGETLVVDGQPWRLSLPQPLPSTVEARRPPVSAVDLSLHFGVSRDEEHVEVTVRLGSDAHKLPPRAHHYLLLTLARARLGDRDEPDAEQGWLTMTDLVKMLRQSTNQLYVSLHRIRREFEALRVLGGFEPVERRSGRHQLRIGARTLSVETL